MFSYFLDTKPLTSLKQNKTKKQQKTPKKLLGKNNWNYTSYTQ